MKPFDFWHEYSFSDYTRKSFFYFRNKNDEFKDNWERLRQQIHVLASLKGVKDSAKELMPFTWDKAEKKTKGKQFSKEELDNILKQYEPILK